MLVKLMVAGRTEGAGGHCEATALILYNHHVFDWLDETLGV